jgi:hypothetical protein
MQGRNDQRRTAGRAGAGLASLAVHGAILGALALATPPPGVPEPRAIEVSLISPPPRPEPPPPPEPPPAEAPDGPAQDDAAPAAAATPPAPAPKIAPPTPPPRQARPAPRPPEIPPLPVPPQPKAPTYALLSAAQTAGAITVGAGPGGGVGGTGASGTGAGEGAGGGGSSCSMVARLQAALRKDPSIQATVAQASAASGAGGRALHLWNGQWVQSPGQAGRGLAGVRQAIAVEVAFAPEACRRDAVSGHVVLSLADGPSAPRIALGAGQWRWSDLLEARR